MPQGFDISTLNPAYRMRILDALMGETQPVIEQVFGIENTSQKSGTIPIDPSKYNVGNSDQADEIEVALEGEPVTIDAALGSASFNIKSKFAARGKLAFIEAMALEDVGISDIVERTGRKAMVQVASAIDRKGKGFLDGTTDPDGNTVNDSVNAAAVWTDPTASTLDPWGDFDSAFDSVGNANTVWLGVDKMRQLTAMDPFLAEYHNFAGTNSRVTPTGVAELFMRMYPTLQSVVIDDNWYNTANLEVTASYSRIYDGVVWVGHSDHMLVVENSGLRKFRSHTDEDRDIYYTDAVRYLTFARGEQKMGCVIASTE